MTKMTGQEFQDELHSLYQGDIDTPTSGDDEWQDRFRKLKTAIREWAGEKGIVWGELWKLLSDAADGGKTVLTATLAYDCPTDFDFPGAWVKTGSAAGGWAYWDVVSPERAQSFGNASMQCVFFTGNQSDGMQVNFMKQPTVGDTIEYPYYKKADVPDADDDGTFVIEMSDPMFAIYFVLSQMHEIDGEGDRAVKAIRQAQAKMDGMRTRNVMPAFLQENRVLDHDSDGGRTSGFGV